MKRLAVLGSTGSIGVSTLDVVARHPDRFECFALTAYRDADRLAAQCRVFEPAYAVMVDQEAADRLRSMLSEQGLDTVVLSGTEALEYVAAHEQVDYVMAAIVGAAGLCSSLAAARAGKRIMLANKETLVVAGKLFMDTVRQNDAALLPIDSEHNAIYQCMPGDAIKDGVSRILLTASGGPFRQVSPDTLDEVTPEQACAHPNWAMGRKISVDSATMMNKGLELIEACWLFDVSPDEIEVVVHPQSIIHSMVQYVDGSVLAQLGNPDMRTPIAYALAWPERVNSGVEPLDIFAIGQLDFEKPDFDRFPCLSLAYQAAGAGGSAPVVLNAANEAAVAAFLERKLSFPGIATIVGKTLDKLEAAAVSSVDELLDIDRRARDTAAQFIEELRS